MPPETLCRGPDPAYITIIKEIYTGITRFAKPAGYDKCLLTGI